MEEILTRFKRWEKHAYKENIINSWPMITYIKRKIDSFDSKLYSPERVNFCRIVDDVRREKSHHAIVIGPLSPFCPQKRWPGSARFSGYYAFTLNQWHSVMDESRSEASIICFRPNSKTSIAFPMIYEHVWWKNDRCVVSWSNRFSRFIYFRLISLTGENLTKTID